MMDTFVDTLDDNDIMGMQDELTPVQRMRWEASIEREIAEGKPQKPISCDEFWMELRKAAIRRY